MAYVSNTQDEAAPTVLIVESNVMSVQRLTTIFKIKDFNIEICEDGDKAVDEYIRLDPELVVISLDIPSLDGHLAALEMREHGGEARIMFVAPRRLAKLTFHCQSGIIGLGVLFFVGPTTLKLSPNTYRIGL